MNIYIDENMPDKLAKGLDILQQPLNKKQRESINVLSIKEIFKQGAADEEWIPFIGKEKAVVITQDLKINRIYHQKELCDKYELGIFFLNPPSKNGFSYWEMVKLIIRHWEKITQYARKKKRPFTYRISSRGEIKEL